MQSQQYRGFLLTCDQNRQKQALKDAYNFLSMYIQQIYDDLVAQAIQKKLKTQNKQLTLQTQLKENRKVQNRLFFSIDTKVKCLIFVKINQKYKQIDPLLVVSKIMQDVYQRNKQVTRYCHKILPVERAFKAEHFKMLDVVDQLFNQKTEKGVIKSWFLNFKCRNNSKFNYKEILKQCEAIAAKYGHFTDIYYPEWSLNIQITHHLMCMSISEKYKQCLEYKLHKTIPKQQRPRKQVEQKVQFVKEQKQQFLKQQKVINKCQVTQQTNKQLSAQQIEQLQKKQKAQQLKRQKLHTQIIKLIEDDDVDLI